MIKQNRVEYEKLSSRVEYGNKKIQKRHRLVLAKRKTQAEKEKASPLMGAAAQETKRCDSLLVWALKTFYPSKPVL